MCVLDKMTKEFSMCVLDEITKGVSMSVLDEMTNVERTKGVRVGGLDKPMLRVAVIGAGLLYK